jgi:hypothetical protein
LRQFRYGKPPVPAERIDYLMIDAVKLTILIQIYFLIDL